MTVKELIEELEKFDGDDEVMIDYDYEILDVFRSDTSDIIVIEPKA